MKRKGFTLIELLVVISIITLLVSIILPSLGKARMYSKRVVCLTNLKAIGTGFVLYMDENPGCLPEAIGFPPKPPGAEIVISNIMVKYVPKKAWRCPADDRSYFEERGTSYEYIVGDILTVGAGLPAFQGMVQEWAMKLITEGDDGTLAALLPDASPEVLEQLSRPLPLAIDAAAFHPTSKMPEGMQAVYHSTEVKLIDWQDLSLGTNGTGD